MKYTKEILETVIKDCVSVAGVLRSLGLKEAGGAHTIYRGESGNSGLTLPTSLAKGLIMAQTIKDPERPIGKKSSRFVSEDGDRRRIF